MSDVVHSSVVEVGVDGSGVERGMQGVVRSFKEGEAAATESGRRMAEGLSQADRATETLNASQRRLSAQVKRATEEYGLNRYEVLALRAEKAGLGSIQSAEIAQLRSLGAEIRTSTASTQAATVATHAYAESEAQATARVRAMVAASLEQANSLRETIEASRMATDAAREHGAASGAYGAGWREATAQQTAGFNQVAKEVNEVSSALNAIGRGAGSMETIQAQTDSLVTLFNEGRISSDQYAAAVKRLDLSEAALAKQTQQTSAAGDRFIANLREQAETVGMTTAQVLEYRAAQLGISDQAAPYIKRLSDTSNVQGAATLTARQYAQAMRQLPMQITDVTTSLASGMPIWLVAVQQGGQIKDSFGGVGGALRAVASLITPTAVAIGGLAAAFGGAAYVAYQAHQETQELNNALTLTGNRAGLTVEQLRGLGSEIGRATGQYGNARSAVLALAQSGRFAGGELQTAARGVVAGVELTGKSVDELVRDFEALGKSPLETLMKLNEQQNFMTAEMYRTVAALEDQGRETDAARKAQEFYANSLEERRDEVVANIGTFERAWRAVKSEISGAIAAAKNFGRDRPSSEIQDEIDRLSADIRAVPEGGDILSRYLPFLDNERESLTARLRPLMAELSRAQAAEAAGAEAAAASAARRAEVELAQALKDYEEGGRSREERHQRELKAENDKWKKISAQLAAGSAEYTRFLELHQNRVADINKKYEDKSTARAPNADVANLRGRVAAERELHGQLVEKYRALMAGTEVTAKVNEGERLSLQYAEQLTGKMTAKARAQLEARKAQADALGVQLRENDALKAQIKVQEEHEKQRERDAAARQREIDQINDKAIATEDEVAAFGKSREELQRLTIARLEEQRTVLAGFPGSEAEIERINREIAARERLGVAISEKEALEKQAKATKRTVDLWIDAIDGINDTFRESFADMINGGQSSWEAFAQSLKTTFKTTVADAIYRMFAEPFVVSVVAEMAGIVGGSAVRNGILEQAGQAAGGLGNLGSLASTIGNGIKTVGGWLGIGAAGTAAAAGTASAAAGLGLGASALGTGAAAMTGAGLGTASAAAGLGLTGSALGAGMGAATGAGLGLTAGGATLGGVAGTSAAVTGAAAGAGAGVMGAIGAAAPYAALALAAYSLLSGSFKGETRHGAQYGLAVDGSLTNNRRGTTVSAADGVHFLEGPSGGAGDDATSRAAIASTVATINDVLRGVGSSLSLAGYWAGWESSEKGRGGVMAGGRWTSGDAFGESGQGDNYRGTLYDMNVSRSLSPEQAAEAFVGQLYQSTIQAWQAAADELPAMLSDMLSAVDAGALSREDAQALVERISQIVQEVQQLGIALEQLPLTELRDLTFDQRAALLEFGGGLQAFGDNLAAFTANYVPAQERYEQGIRNVERALADAGVTMPPLVGTADEMRAAYRSLAQQQDLGTEAGQRAYAAVVTLNGAYAELIGMTETLAAAERDRLDAERQRLAAEAALVEQAYTDQAAAVRNWADQAARYLDARNAAGALSDRIGSARGRDPAYAAAHEADLWARLATAGFEHQIELAGELADIVLPRYQAEIDAANRLRDLGRNLAGYLETLSISDLSPLTLGQRTAEAERQLMETIAKAQAGDVDAMAQVQSQLEASLRLWREYGASGSDYQAAYARLTGAAGDLAQQAQSDAERQLGVSQQTLGQLEQLQGVADRTYDAMNRQYQAAMQATQRELTVLTAMASDANRLQDVAGLLRGMPAGIAAALQPVLSGALGNIVSGWYADAGYGQGDQAGRDYWQGQLGNKPGSEVQKDFLHALVTDWYRDALGWSPDAAGLAYWMAEAQRIGAAAAKGDFYRTVGIPGYQDGGVTGTGLAWVGERGPEIVDFRSPARVYNNADLGAALRAPAGGDAAAAIVRLTDRIAVLEDALVTALGRHANATVLSAGAAAERVVAGFGGAFEQRKRDDIDRMNMRRNGVIPA